MIHHQMYQSRAIHQHNPVHRFGKVDSVCRETGGGDEHPTLSLLPGECTVECLQLRAAYRVLPAFGLNVNLFQSQFVEGDDPINAGIPRPTDTLQVIATSAVSQAMKHIQHNHFEAVGADL